LSAQYGEYYESDGERISVSGNIGLPLTDAGFVNLTGEYSTSDITWRGIARPDAAAFEDIVGPGIVPLDGLGQRWGDPDVEAIPAGPWRTPAHTMMNSRCRSAPIRDSSCRWTMFS
jgi:iron complex outermembrane receptor protein